MDEQIFNTPKDIEVFKGQFIVFFSEEANPTILFSSFIAEEAYNKAKEIEKQYGKQPIVIRVEENVKNNISQVLFTRA